MSATEIDYDALAKQYGAASAPPPGADSSVDYDSLAKQFGATPPEAKPEIESSKLPTEVQRAVTSVPRPAPPVGLTPGNRYVAAPNQQSPEVRLGNLLPENSAPALFAAKKYAVDPFEKAAAKGGEVGAELAERGLFTAPPTFTGNQPITPAFNRAEAEKEFPIATGVARGVGSVVGSTAADPRNWPFFASSAARPILQRLISGGFGAQMTAGTIQAAKNLYQNWDSLTPSQRAELATQGGLTAVMAAGSVSHALSPAPDVQPTRAELAEHLDRTNFHSPEALKASWTAEQQSREAPAETGATQATLAKTPTGPTDSIADQYDAQVRRQGAEVPAGPSSVDYDALARQNGAISSTPPSTKQLPTTDAVSGNRIAPKIDTSPTQSPAGSAPTSFADRRVNLTERKRIGEMTPEEMRRELLTSPVTGLPNRRAFDEAGPGDAVAMSDADGLKAFNDRFGYEAGDALLRAKADALKQAGLTAFHDKGDEFVYRGTSTADLQSKLENARQTFRNMVIEATLPDGTVKYLKGVDFSYGTGKELSDAETALKAHKSEREARGERIRGGLPGVAEVSPGNEIPVPSRQAEAREVAPVYETHYRGPSLDIEDIDRIRNDKKLSASLRESAQFVHEQVVDTRVPINDAMNMYGSDELAKALGGKFDKTLNAISPTISAPVRGELAAPSAGRGQEVAPPADRKGALQKEISDLQRQYDDLSAQVNKQGWTHTPPDQLRKVNEVRQQILEREDEIARLSGQPTRAEKRAIRDAAAGKAFGDRPREAMTYGSPEQSQHWQVAEPDYIEKRFAEKVKTYERGIDEKKAEVEKAKPGTKARNDALMTQKFWEDQLQRFKDRDPRLAQSFKNEYNDLVKKAVSQGKPVPEAVIAQKREFETAKDARERYEKGRHTSFANKSAAINDTMQKEEGFKVKRQDGKPITDEQIQEIRESVQDVAKVLGPLKDIMGGVDLTIVHTSGTYPFLMNDAAGLYNDFDRRITLGLKGAWTKKPYAVFAHEFGHLIDIKGGNLLERKTRTYTKGGKGYDSTSLAEAEARSPLIDQAKKSINDMREVKDLFRMMDNKKADDMTEAEKTAAEMVKVKLGPYFYEPREIFARLFEQYIGNELGRKGPANMAPEAYAKIPGYWTQEEFDKLKPMLEQEIERRTMVLREHYAPKDVTRAEAVAALPSPVAAKPPESTSDLLKSEAEAKVVPGARSAVTGNETGTTTMQDLTDSIRRQVGEKRPLMERLKTGADIGQTAADAKDAVSTSWNRLKGGAAALWDAYKRPPKWSDYEDATGKWSGADQANALDLDRFTKAIKDTVPDKLRREAISNWIEAGGDDSLLRERAEKSVAPHRDGYEAALSLTDADKTIARNIMNRNDATLEEAQRAGLLQQGVENYVRHIWADNPKMVSKVMAEMNFNSLQTKPSFTKERKLPTYFDGEQIGLKPKDKDVGFLTASHERAFREALAARAYIKSLMEGKASDGRPLVATSWASAKELPATEGIKSAAYLVKPNITPEAQFADYRPIDHPALRGWRWAGKTESGQPIFVQGDALVHPEIYTKLKNNLGKSAIRSYAMEIGGHTVRPGAAVLNVSSEIKHAILSFSGFHQTTLGIHALEHRTLPAAMPELDLSQPKQKFLVDHGLMVAQYDAAEAFGEGLASGGLVTKIPGIGPAYHAYTDYLFKSYLPRVKMAMALNALERNTRIYGDKLSADQIGALTARQANAAFGGLNYKLLGRNKTLQDVMRLAFMAPDFTEARARFVGQAARPYNREQLTALLGGALAFYTVGRLLNQAVDNDPHWDKPFSLVHNGKEYKLRTVQGDFWSAINEPGKYVRNRLSPLASTSIMAAEGRDRFGRKQSLGELAKDVATSNVPIPLQSWTKESDDPLAKKAFSTILKMVGVNESTERSKAEQLALDLRWSSDRAMTSDQKEHYALRRRLIDEVGNGNWKPMFDARAKGQIDQREVREIEHDVRLGPLAARVSHFTYANFLKVYEAATPEEKKQLAPILERKREILLKKGLRAAQ